jgi:hypothetical protein
MEESEERKMKRKMLSVVAVLAFAPLAAGAAYAHVDKNGWCTGNSGWSHMMGSSMGKMMGSSTGQMTGPSTGHMMARHDGKDQSNDCPGWNTGNRGSGIQESGSN